MPSLAQATRMEENAKWMNNTYLWETLSVVDLREAGALPRTGATPPQAVRQ